jgi:hypothetical protein
LGSVGLLARYDQGRLLGSPDRSLAVLSTRDHRGHRCAHLASPASRVEEPLRFIWVMLDSSGASGQCVDYGLWPLRFTRLLPELPLSTNTPLRSATGTGFEWARLVAGESSLRGSPAGGNGGKAASSSSFERTVSHGVAWSAPGVEGASARPNVRSTSAAARCRALKVSGSDLRFACFFFGVFIPTL